MLKQRKRPDEGKQNHRAMPCDKWVRSIGSSAHDLGNIF